MQQAVADRARQSFGPAPEVGGLERRLGLEAVLSRVDLGPRGPSRIGRFIVESRLGEGAMGVVYRARDPEQDRPVAIKVTRSACTDEIRRQVRAEACALARAAHPNVVGVHEVGCHHGELYVVMELVEGPSLDRWIRRASPPPGAVLGACIQVAEGLIAVHRAGLVHRDVKPANILVGDDGRVRIADFGLAALDAEATVAYTPAYASPEVRAGRPGDARSDQFSFCRTLEEALGAVGIDGRRDPVIEVILRRGCAEDPAARWLDMNVLVAVLRQAQLPGAYGHGHGHGHGEARPRLGSRF